MATALRLLLLFVAAAAAAAVAASGDGVIAQGDQGADVHDLLPTVGLPKGLLPDSVVGYTLTDDGEFTVELKAPCYVHFSNLVYYEKRIRGKISYGAISNLSGISAKKLFVWVSVTGIQAHTDGTIEFKVGFISESLSESEFESIPVCKAKAFSRGRGGFFPKELLPAVSEV